MRVFGTTIQRRSAVDSARRNRGVDWQAFRLGRHRSGSAGRARRRKAMAPSSDFKCWPSLTPASASTAPEIAGACSACATIQKCRHDPRLNTRQRKQRGRRKSRSEFRPAASRLFFDRGGPVRVVIDDQRLAALPERIQFVPEYVFAGLRSAQWHRPRFQSVVGIEEYASAASGRF